MGIFPRGIFLEPVRRYSSFYFSSFIFKVNQVLVEENNPSKFFLIIKEELEGIHIDDIGNSEDLLRIVFIHEECANLKVFVYDGELTRNVNKKKKPVVLQAGRCPLCDKVYRREYFFNKHVEYCESVK